MKPPLASLALVGLLIGGSLASAQVTQSLPPADTAIWATFYDGNPYSGGAILEEDTLFHKPVRVKLDDGAIAAQIHDAQDATHLMLDVGDIGLAFEITPGSSKHTIAVKFKDEKDDRIVLADLVADLTAALAGERELAIFTDAKGVVTGFYAYPAGHPPTIKVAEASFVLISHDGFLDTLATSTHGVSPLEGVHVLGNDGEDFTLRNMLP